MLPPSDHFCEEDVPTYSSLVKFIGPQGDHGIFAELQLQGGYEGIYPRYLLLLDTFPLIGR